MPFSRHQSHRRPKPTNRASGGDDRRTIIIINQLMTATPSDIEALAYSGCLDNIIYLQGLHCWLKLAKTIFRDTQIHN